MLVGSRPDTSKAETPASVQNIVPPDQERDGHRQPHHDPGLNGSGTYGEHDEIRDRKPNGDPEDPFRGPLECLSGATAPIEITAATAATKGCSCPSINAAADQAR